MSPEHRNANALGVDPAEDRDGASKSDEVVQGRESFIRTNVDHEVDVETTGVRARDVLAFTEDHDQAIESREPHLMGELEAFYEGVRALHEGEGMSVSHELFLESLYSRRFLPLLKNIFKHCDEITEVMDVNRALDSLKEVMMTVRACQQREDIDEAQAFLNLYEEALDGGNDFLMKVKVARDTAVRCILDNKRVLAQDPVLFGEAEGALLENLELESGLQLPPEFRERLFDPNTKSVVVSLDFNSTFNFDESFASMELVARAQRALKKFARDFRRAFPQKELFISINTGRPGHYAWGVVESAFAPIPEVRKVAVAECGGVVLEEGLTSGVMNVAVEHPHEWKRELDYIRDYLLSRIQNAHDVIVEPKLSMLSIRLAEDDRFVLKTMEGEPVTPEWIEEQLASYFFNTEKVLGSEFQELMDDIERDIPHMTEYTRRAIEALGVDSGRSLNGGKRRAMNELEHFVDEVREDHMNRINEIKARLATITTMYDEGLLQAQYNPTAGYVDIGHANLNKFSTLMRHVCSTQRLTPDEVLYLQLGDSTTDILPEEKIYPGGPNEGAHQAFLVAVKNCNEKLHRAVGRRGDRGLMTSQPSVLGAEALFKGLSRMVKSARA